MLYYAIADLHGRYDLLEKALEKIAEDVLGYANEPVDHKIITLGDYIDRGPQSAEIIKFLRYRVGHDTSGNELICLKGNHEAMMVDSITTLPSIDWWLSNGGDATLRSYNAEPGFTFGKHYEILLQQGVVPDDDVKWMANLPVYYETEHHVFVHAGIPTDDLDLKDQSTEELMWMLYSKRDNGGYRDKHVVHGHHQFADGPHEWAGRTDLDTFAYKTGRLVIGVFSSDSPGKAIRYLEVLGDDYGIDGELLRP